MRYSNGTDLKVTGDIKGDNLCKAIQKNTTFRRKKRILVSQDFLLASALRSCSARMQGIFFFFLISSSDSPIPTVQFEDIIIVIFCF